MKTIKSVLSIVVVLAGASIGVISSAPEKSLQGDDLAADAVEDDYADQSPEKIDIIKLNNQFVVPVIENGDVISLIIATLSLETELGTRETIFQLEPKIRDALLSTLFDHANSGAFSGVFTERLVLRGLRSDLTKSANQVLDGKVYRVLITDLVRQDSKSRSY